MEKSNLKPYILDYDSPINYNDNIIYNVIFSEKKVSASFSEIFPNISERVQYKFYDLLGCKYIFIKLPQIQDDKILIIGPYLNEETSQNKILECSEKFNLPPTAVKLLELYFTTVPILRDEGQFFAVINTFCEQIWGGVDGYSSIDIEQNVHSIFNFVDKEKQIDFNVESDWQIEAVEKRYAYENELLRAVSRGQTHKAEQMLLGFSSTSFESRSNDDLRNLKNYAIIMNTLLRKAAQDGGVHPIHLDKLSSDFAKKIEQLSSLRLVKEFMSKMLTDYCRLVRIHSIKQYSPLVQRAIIKIESDLTGNLSLKELSKLNNVSESYFSALFKSETGKTLTDYVNTQRIAQAKHLLLTTNLQIQTVAQHSGILDLHYFSKLFKKYTGKTPNEFKKNKL